MDSVYRGQRHIYDFTRKYYLFGRDRLIEGLTCRAGDKLLEMACGTGRNLDLAGRRWPDVQLYGFDISAEMLKNARARFGDHVRLAQGDATRFEPRAMFGIAGFDRIILSYSLSMIPEWKSAMEQAAAALARGGSLHIVDFGDLEGLPRPFAAGLRAWLQKFHVEPRVELPAEAEQLAAKLGLTRTTQRGSLGYYRIEVLRKP